MKVAARFMMCVLFVVVFSLGCGSSREPHRRIIKTAEVQINLFKDYLELYKLSVRTYPSTEQGLQALVTCPSNVDKYVWPGPLTESIPLDPWGNPYQYEFPGKHNSALPDLWSLGPDGEDGTDDDVCSWIVWQK